MRNGDVSSLATSWLPNSTHEKIIVKMSSVDSWLDNLLYISSQRSESEHDLYPRLLSSLHSLLSQQTFISALRLRTPDMRHAQPARGRSRLSLHGSTLATWGLVSGWEIDFTSSLLMILSAFLLPGAGPDLDVSGGSDLWPRIWGLAPFRELRAQLPATATHLSNISEMLKNENWRWRV